MRYLLDTNILIPLENSQLPLESKLADFIRLANENGHQLLYHPASEEDIRQDLNLVRRDQTLQRLQQYSKLDSRPTCPWNSPTTNRNDAADNEILYALSLNAAHALVTEDRGIHAKAKTRGLADRVYTIQTIVDQLRRLHELISVQLPNIEDIPLYALTPLLESDFFDSLREGYPGFNTWFESKAQEGRRAWVSWVEANVLGGICIYNQQDNEQITEDQKLSGIALKLATFKVGETSRGNKIGELLLKTAFRYATNNELESIFIHGDTEKHHFLFEMLVDFGFMHVGYHPGSNGRDAVYLKRHPIAPPQDELPAFDYSRRYFPQFLHNQEIAKFIVPIQPRYHDILFPDYGSQLNMFTPSNTAGNAIKMAYLCHAQTKHIVPGDLVLFYRSKDEKAITSIGVVESYETLSDPGKIATKVKRRTVYTMGEIDRMAMKPTRVMLFRLVRHFTNPLSQTWLEQNGVLNGAPQSITRIGHDKFERAMTHGR